MELLESTAPDGPIAKYLEKKGEGIQHVAFRVENIEAALNELKEKGIRLIDEKPRTGAGGARIAFLHPKSTNGVLVELCERERTEFRLSLFAGCSKLNRFRCQCSGVSILI